MGHCESAGGVAEQEPLHWTVPVFVMPQLLADEVQEVPTLETQLVHCARSAGGVALHVPLHCTVPELVSPQLFWEEVQEVPTLETHVGGHWLTSFPGAGVTPSGQ